MPPSPILVSKAYPPTVGCGAVAGTAGVPFAGVRGVLVTSLRLIGATPGSRLAGRGP